MDTEKRNRIWDTYVGGQDPREYLSCCEPTIRDESDLRAEIDEYLRQMPKNFDNPELNYDDNAELMDDISTAMYETLIWYVNNPTGYPERG